MGFIDFTIYYVLLASDPDLRCPEFPEDDGMSVTYDNERHVSSRAFFSCAKNNQELSGKDTLACLKNGKWSENFPQCIGKFILNNIVFLTFDICQFLLKKLDKSEFCYISGAISRHEHI